MKNQLKSILAAGAFALVTFTVGANSITLNQVSESNVAGGSLWNFDMAFVNSTLNNGDYVNINDFGPATVSIAPPAGWVYSQTFVGPNSIVVADNPSVLNATFTWTGGTVVVSPLPGINVNELFTLFSASSLPIVPVLSTYTTIDQASSGSTAGSNSRVTGAVRVPGTVPDGGLSVAMLGLALMGIEGLRRRFAA